MFISTQVSKFVAFFVGAVFVTIHTLQHNGLIDIKYDRVEQQFTVRILSLLAVVLFQ